MSRTKTKKRTRILTKELVSIAKFDTRKPLVRPIFEQTPLHDTRAIDQNDYSPSGGTPLNDAVLQFIGQLDQNYKENPNALHIGLLADESGSMGHLRNDVIEGFNTFLDEIKSDESQGGEPGVILVIMTDGYENSSTEDPAGDKVKEIIGQKEDEGWNFFYLGANQDAWATGNQLGFGQSTYSATFTNNSQSVRDSNVLAAEAVNYRKGTTSELYGSGQFKSANSTPVAASLMVNGPHESSAKPDEIVKKTKSKES